ncbi:leucine--tRNA ligase [Ferruginibacter albus]|uniref:leucine--tRNA ligase n=1 Tax=Ferruginibacter albus TaxID=2875540 RepID=UPI001CC431F4|nr:class I tRNA ligase family protein [Ferruginibacter albus]
MEYKFNEIEEKWQKHWQQTEAYKVSNNSSKPKYYVLDMFPYPSGAGLHVGHPLGYIASDIYARFKRLKGFNVLHPMGYDSFGLPAEQYALETGQHPAVTTEKNIATFRSQLDKIGFCFDWSREVKTSDPTYYKWTQWIFLQLFNSWFNKKTKKAEGIDTLIKQFETEGADSFTADEWKVFDEKKKMDILMDHRLAYCGYGEVNWCEALGTVLANDEVVNGVSERGGYPVVKKKLRQWYLRITDYADRLLEGLQTVDFSDAMKEMQTNWIGKSYGAEIDFQIVKRETSNDNSRLTSHVLPLRVYTTRPDTIFGVDFMVIAPELEWIDDVKSAEQAAAVDEYIAYVKSRSDRERQAEKKISGVFTGAYAINPFNGKEIPIWISEYVLAGYGTGAIMAVPCGDERDFKFAQHFNIPITNIIGSHFNGEEANATKDAILENSDFLNGMVMRDAIDIVLNKIEAMGIGKRKTNFKMRDAAFSRQRYWGEPFPIKWHNGIAYSLNESELPVQLPHVESYKPGPEGEGPLANIPEWVAKELETNTMPGYAGSSWYFLRYMDPHNDKAFCDKSASDYWNQVDLYIGGTEHAVGHLLYSRMWTKVLFDLGLIGFDEPFKRLVNQGMITGKSYFIKKVFAKNVSIKGESRIGFLISTDEALKYEKNTFKHQGKIDYPGVNEYHAEYDSEDFRLRYGHLFVDSQDRITEKNLKELFQLMGMQPVQLENDLEYILWKDDLTENGERYLLCKCDIEKMSKSKYNVENPDNIITKYGADTFRMYEMFLGPVEQSKPWDTKGIEGVHRFLRKLWRLFFDEVKGKVWNTDKPTEAELKILHKTIKKIEEDTERFSFNTAVSTFMIGVNELSDAKCNKKEILEQLLILLTPYAPHIAEELWNQLGNEGSVLDAKYPTFNPQYLIESSKEYPVSINGKHRTNITIAMDALQADVEQIVLTNDVVLKWTEGKPPKKIIFVKGKMVNIVV